MWARGTVVTGAHLVATRTKTHGGKEKEKNEIFGEGTRENKNELLVGDGQKRKE